jgi:hypothetical protein
MGIPTFTTPNFHGYCSHDGGPALCCEASTMGFQPNAWPRVFQYGKLYFTCERGIRRNGELKAVIYVAGPTRFVVFNT